jgi:cytochrome c oxidase cbb3-type subunit 1
MTTNTQHTLLSTSLGTGKVSAPPAAGAVHAEKAAAFVAAPAPANKMEVTERDIENVERALIDQSARGPVLTFFTTAVFWLLVSCTLGYIASKKLHSPDFILGPEWLYKLLGIHGWMSWLFERLTYGRVWPAYNTALVYGWCSLAGMGVSTWLIGRLTRVSIKAPGILRWGAWFWNAGVAAGVITLLTGVYNSGLEHFELHPSAKACMLIGFLLIGVWGLVLFRYRRSAVPYISVSYLVAAFFLFPWFFGATTFLSAAHGVNGVTKNIVNAWYQGGLFNLWFSCIGLAAAYYFIPKVVNRSIYSYNLAKIGFWSWVFLGGLTAMTRLSGGPVPAYLITLSVAASILLIVPLSTVMTNLGRTVQGKTGMMAWSPTLRFVFVGTVFFGIAGGLTVLGALRSVDSYTHFTSWTHGQTHMLLLGFYSMVMFGAIYYITPRLVGCEWLSRTFIKLHFLGTAYGGATIVGLFLMGGIATGFTLNNSTVDDARVFTFANVPQDARAYQLIKTYIGYVIFGIAQIIFAIHFLFMRLRIGQPAGEPTLLMNPEDAH